MGKTKLTETLEQIITDLGREILDEPVRIQRVFLDYCPDRREAEKLKVACDTKVFQQLVSASKTQQDCTVLCNKVIHTLMDERFWSEEIAQQLVYGIADALKLQYSSRALEEERKRQEAEAARKAEEARKRQEAEAARKAEEARKRQEAEAARKAEEDRKRKEAAAMTAALRKAEAARKAEEERKRREAAAAAEAVRKAEEARKRNEAEARRKMAAAVKQKEAEERRKAEEAKRAEEARQAAQRVLEAEKKAKRKAANIWTIIFGVVALVMGLIFFDSLVLPILGITAFMLLCANLACSNAEGTFLRLLNLVGVGVSWLLFYLGDQNRVCAIVLSLGLVILAIIELSAARTQGAENRTPICTLCCALQVMIIGVASFLEIGTGYYWIVFFVLLIGGGIAAYKCGGDDKMATVMAWAEGLLVGFTALINIFIALIDDLETNGLFGGLLFGGEIAWGAIIAILWLLIPGAMFFAFLSGMDE